MDMPDSEYRFEKYGRFWAVYDGAGRIVCVAVYRKGAREVVRRLSSRADDIRENEKRPDEKGA